METRRCNYKIEVHQVCCYLQPDDLQVQFDGAQVIDVHSHHLRHGSEQVLSLTDHTAHQHMSGKSFQLGYLRKSHQELTLRSGGSTQMSS